VLDAANDTATIANSKQPAGILVAATFQYQDSDACNRKLIFEGGGNGLPEDRQGELSRELRSANRRLTTRWLGAP
jgi:hypothetical protein